MVLQALTQANPFCQRLTGSVPISSHLPVPMYRIRVLQYSGTHVSQQKCTAKNYTQASWLNRQVVKYMSA